MTTKTTKTAALSTPDTEKRFIQRNFKKTTKGGETCNVGALDVHGENVNMRKFEIFAIAPAAASFDDLFAPSDFCGAYAVYKGDDETAAVLSVDDKGALRNNTAANLMNKANTVKGVRDNIVAAAKAWHCNKATRKAASIMNDPEALALVEQLLAERAAAEKKAAAAAKRAAKKAAEK